MPGDPPAPAPAPLFDSHAHLADSAFAVDLPQVLERTRAANVVEVLVPATVPEDADRAAALAGAAGPVRLMWSAGLHPHEARLWGGEAKAAVEERLAKGAVAVGETGLDFHYDHSPRERQLEAFEAQAEIARAHDLPLIVHSREADDATAAALRASGVLPERVILHCFSAGPGLFREALERGYYLSFSGLITFRRYPTPQYLADTPAERLLVETDAPYLAPVPLRGRRNEPGFLPATVARLARARGLDPGRTGSLTRANALRVYKLPDPS